MTILQADFKSKQVVSADSSDKKPVIGVAGDNATRTIRFLLDKDVDELPKGINLNSIAWEMQYENVNLQRGSVLPDSVKDEGGKRLSEKSGFCGIEPIFWRVSYHRGRLSHPSRRL